jgi:Leucine-rich repeat (LRR) protein
LLVFVSVFRGVKLVEKTIRCEAFRVANLVPPLAVCVFRGVSFNRDTKLKIEPDGDPDATDEEVKALYFSESPSVSLDHPDIGAKFPNIEEVSVEGSKDVLSELNIRDTIGNCQNIKVIFLRHFTVLPSNPFADCKKLEYLRIETESLSELPDGLLKNQQNLQKFTLVGKDLRVSSFEGLTSLSELTLESVDLSQIEGNFFRNLNIKKLMFNGKLSNSFPIESLNSQKTIEELVISGADLSQHLDTLGPTLRSMKKLRTIEFRENSIRSVEAFVDLPNVEKIDLRGNKMEELPANAFKGCPRLSKLTLGSTIDKLRGDEFNQLSGLKELAVSTRKSTTIASTIFHPLRSLESLELAFTGHDNIISKELFMYSTNLRSLKLFWNKILAIHPEAFDNLYKLTLLDLDGNDCVDEKFEAPEGKILDMTLVKLALKKCFKNFTSQVVS